MAVSGTARITATDQTAHGPSPRGRAILYVTGLAPCTYRVHTRHMPHTTVTQNQDHRTDIAWIKTPGRSFAHNGEHYTSEYRNVFTGQAIRKGWRMTGRDWHIFDAEGNETGRAHSLTWAKLDAAKA